MDVHSALVKRIAELHCGGDLVRARQYANQCTAGFAALADLIRERLEPGVIREADYDSPSWSHKQAHQNGKLEGLDLVLSLLPRADRP